MLILMAKENLGPLAAAVEVVTSAGLEVEAIQLRSLLSTFIDILNCVDPKKVATAQSKNQGDVVVSPEWQPHIDQLLCQAVEYRALIAEREVKHLSERLEALQMAYEKAVYSKPNPSAASGGAQGLEEGRDAPTSSF